MSKNHEQVKARIRFLFACDGIQLSEARLERIADSAEQAAAGAEDPAWTRAKERATVEGRSAAELLLEEAKSTRSPNPHPPK